MATVWKHPHSPYWSAVYKDENNRWRKKTTKETNRTEALNQAIALERAAAMGRSRTLTEAISREIIGGILERTTGEKLRYETVRAFCIRWLRGKTAKRAQGTATRYRGTVDKFLTFLGPKAELPISAVTPVDCEGFFDNLTEGQLAPATLIVEMKTIRTLFNSARRQGLISTNPAAAVELPTRVEQVKRLTFAPEQVKMLLGAVAEAVAEAGEDTEKGKAAQELRTAILLGYYAGVRLTDAVTLTWDNVDLAGGKLEFRMHKTGANIAIPLHPTLSAHLTNIAGDQSGPLCPCLSVIPVGGRSGLSKQFLSLMRRAGISNEAVATGGQRNLSRLSYHSLRKSFNSALHNRGVDQELRMKLTGHRDAEVNDRYTETELETLRAAVRKLPSIAL